jgi:hypothetical protein
MTDQSVQYVELKDDDNGMAHLALYSSVEAKQPARWLTTGNFEVTQILCDDPIRKKM